MMPALHALAAIIQLTPQMRAGISGARYVAVYSNEQRAEVMHKMLHVPKTSVVTRISLTPNAPSAGVGTHLSFWKTSFVLGTAVGGEAGVNFWGIHTGGHINIGFIASGLPTVLDCRVLGRVTEKLYVGAESKPREQFEAPLDNGHLLFVLPDLARETPVSVELWPKPSDAAMGFLGCEIDVPIAWKG
jgi:hypothetical protein